MQLSESRSTEVAAYAYGRDGDGREFVAASGTVAMVIGGVEFVFPVVVTAAFGASGSAVEELGIVGDFTKALTANGISITPDVDGTPALSRDDVDADA
mmetsp:Transcript_42675/g.133773  ORF Transcript_42675/g.133773 Transcript_42675/m.133773 type:complete len:98 (-) Transcript_42675:1-294(-)